jgi:glycosyltransferase involved in cell wall biosynthesis
MRLANRLAIRRALCVTADSRDLIDRCVALGAVRERTALIQWGVDVEAFSPPGGDRAGLKAELGLGPGPVILSPRSLMPVYNIPTVIEAFAKVGERLPDSQLVLKHMGAVRVALPDLPHSDRVHLVGNVPYERMADYYRAADVCVSVTSSDSSPRSVWEAMACGCPCVLSDLPWVGEMIEAGRDAITVPIDPDSVAEALTRVIEDHELARSLALRGRALVERDLNREAEMDKLARLYRGLAG